MDDPNTFEVTVVRLGHDRAGRSSYMVYSERADVRFWTFPAERGGKKGWDVEIEGRYEVPGRRGSLWPTDDAARDAAIRAIRQFLQFGGADT